MASITGYNALKRGGVMDNGANTTLTLISDDGGNSTLEAIGRGYKGTGRLYVGQGSTQTGGYGGGIEYNGDGSPSTTGAGTDYVTLWRRNEGTDQWTARNKYDSNVWEFRETPKAGSYDIWHAGNDGSASGLDADLLDGQHGSYFRNASNLNAGTLSNARLANNSIGAEKFQEGATEELWVCGRIADVIVGQIGTYAFLRCLAGGTSPGSTRSGSNLRYAAAYGDSGTSPSGTWRCMGWNGTGNPDQESTVWLRIS